MSTEEGRARTAESAAQLHAGAVALLESGQVDEAVRVFLSIARPQDAAEALLGYVTRRPRPLVAEDRARALRAAQLFDEVGAHLRAAEVLAWIGATAEGQAIVQRLLDRGAWFEGGACLVRLGDPGRGIEVLLRVPRSTEASFPPQRSGPQQDSPRPKADEYIAACVECARGLVRGAAMSMELDRFLADFIRRGPESDAEAEALYAVAAAYAREGFPENAAEALLRIEARRPGFRDAAAQARRLEAGLRSAVQDFARVLDEDERFAGASVAPDAPRDFPTEVHAASDLPGGPRAPAAGADADAVQLAAESFSPGVVLAKRYRLEELIGRGGMSVVYRATDMELSQQVALKIFTQPTNEDALARFKQEVLLARQLIHRNVVRVYDIGTALGARFLTMELLVGEDMHTRMVHGISMRDGIDFLTQACAGLEAAHQVGVIHRDIKPENLFITKEGILKVTDFGIAKQLAQPGFTVAGMVVGTPEYMAPEQAHGHMTVTHAADLYSLGIILYFLCTGTLPFRHDEMLPLLMMQVNQAPEPPRVRNPSLPPDVEELVLSLLEKDPTRRPPSARAVGERLIELRLRGIV